jgi:nicotinate phosphoribosyltransferase
MLRSVGDIVIELEQGDIANQPGVDAVVNAANAELRPGGGVAGAIHRAAGPELDRECRRQAPIRPGQAVLTGAHALPNRYVIHCLGPVYGRDEPSDRLLANCYSAALDLCEQNRIESIAFPAISTGVFGYPLEAATRVALRTVVDRIPTLSTVKRIRFVLYDRTSFDAYRRELDALIPASTSPAPGFGETGALFTDYYQLTMAQAYLEEGLTEQAVFSLYVRSLPTHRNYLVACGLDTVLDYLERLRFSSDDLNFLSEQGAFSRRFLDWLEGFRFSGSVFGMREGTPVFADEPLLEVVAPLPEAQIIETFLMNQIHLQTLLASKASRVVHAAGDRPVIDFGSRRIHGTDAALKGARAFYIAGVAATSNVLASRVYGVPATGTMAHSYIQAHGEEADAFRAFVRAYPDSVLLVDTFDTLAGVRTVVDLARSHPDAFSIRAIRLDSGDLESLSKASRALLDDAGLNHVGIIASGGLDEYRIEELLTGNAPLTGFGVGTNMSVSADAPSLDVAYKLCEYAGEGRLKLSPGKPVLPGRKQVFRVTEGGRDVLDVVAPHDELLTGRPLLEQVMENGRRLDESHRALNDVRTYARTELLRLPERIRQPVPAKPAYTVRISDLLRKKAKRVREAVAPPASLEPQPD